MSQSGQVPSNKMISYTRDIKAVVGGRSFSSTLVEMEICHQIWIVLYQDKTDLLSGNLAHFHI